MMTRLRPALLATCVACSVALQARPVPHATATAVRRAASSPWMAGPLEGDGWAQLLGALDKLPVFSVANSEGQPLQYQVGEKSLALFYADIEAAKAQLAAAQDENPELCPALGPGQPGCCDLIPVGLGSAFKLSCDGKAMVVPGLAELQAAGAPEDAQPMGQELPLFACMDMRREGDEAALQEGPVVPLFMSHADCAAYVAEATDASVDISGLSLASIVEQLTGGGAYSFVAPSASMQHVLSYVGKGVYWRPADEEGAAAAS